MIDPLTRDLYQWAQENAPDLYEYLCLMDRDLAQLHLSGMMVQRQRQATLQELQKFVSVKAAIAPRSV